MLSYFIKSWLWGWIYGPLSCPKHGLLKVFPRISVLGQTGLLPLSAKGKNQTAQEKTPGALKQLKSRLSSGSYSCLPLLLSSAFLSSLRLLSKYKRISRLVRLLYKLCALKFVSLLDMVKNLRTQKQPDANIFWVPTGVVFIVLCLVASGLQIRTLFCNLVTL